MNEQKTYSTGANWLYAALALCCVATSAFLVETAARADLPGISDSRLSNMDGRQVYEHICQGCHMPDAGGAVGAGRYPALSKNPTLASRQYMALTILMGRRNMPAFGAKHGIGFGGPAVVLNETQIAAVINYVRTHFGNHFSDSISAAEVVALDHEEH
jgi:mono/diheme cytochrome c family protein